MLSFTDTQFMGHPTWNDHRLRQSLSWRTPQALPGFNNSHLTAQWYLREDLLLVH